jgi:hypothetical protein
MSVVHGTAEMITQMDPVLEATLYHFCTGHKDLLTRATGSIREAEGLSLILPDEVAAAHGLPRDQPMRRITLRVHSALDGVGLTAAVAGALAAAGIACNMVAGHHHDHVFVPAPDADRALQILRDLTQSGAP